jgi:uncharacterized membrane protein YkoI
MDKKTMMIAAVLIAVISIVGGMVWSAEKNKQKEEDAKEGLAMAMAAKIGIEEAIKTALENFPGKVVEVDLEKKQERIVWEIGILTAERGIMSVYVDSDTGSVITTEEKVSAHAKRS